MPTVNRPRFAGRALPLLALLMGAAGCNTDMWRQPKIEPMDAADPGFFADGASARPLVPGTVPRGHLREDEGFYTGRRNGRWLDTIPLEINRDLLERGRDRFDVYCSPCHGRVGDGKGMIAQRGLELRRPVATYHTDRLRSMPVGHFYDVITNGYGAMYSYASRVNPHDRWAIVAYIRALQHSQYAPVAAADPEELRKSTEVTPTETPTESPAH